jgi:uncharacterized protein YoxC
LTSNAQCYRDLSLLNAEYQQLIGDEITAGFSDTNQRLDGLKKLWSTNTNQVDMYHQELTSALRHQLAAVEASAGHQSEKLNGLQSSLTQLSNSTNDSLTKWNRLEMNLMEKDQRLGQTIDSISDRFQDVSSMSSSQLSAIKQLVGVIQGLQLDVEGMRHEQEQVQHTTSLKGGSPNSASSKGKELDSNVLHGSVSRLCNLDATKDKDLFSKEAQFIIQDLGQIIASLVEDTISTAGTGHQLISQGLGICCDCQRKIKGRKINALDQIGNILRASQRLSIREQGNLQCYNSITRSKSWLIPVFHQNSRRVQNVLYPLINQLLLRKGACLMTWRPLF